MRPVNIFDDLPIIVYKARGTSFCYSGEPVELSDLIAKYEYHKNLDHLLVELIVIEGCITNLCLKEIPSSIYCGEVEVSLYELRELDKYTEIIVLEFCEYEDDEA